MQALDVPLYLHPMTAYVQPYVAEGLRRAAKGDMGMELRDIDAFPAAVVFAGVFDRFPRLKIILGHMGETLPYMLWRLDSRAAFNMAAGR